MLKKMGEFMDTLPDWIVEPIVFLILMIMVFGGASLLFFAVYFMPWLLLVVPSIWLGFVLKYFYQRYRK